MLTPKGVGFYSYMVATVFGDTSEKRRRSISPRFFIVIFYIFLYRQTLKRTSLQPSLHNMYKNNDNLLTEKKQVLIVIPIYQLPNAIEAKSIENNLNILNQYPSVFLKPNGLDISQLSKQYPQVKQISVSDQWLGTKNGIAGYNRMMLSAEFYELFAEYEFVLICHVDAWIFRDEVSAWCKRGYDHVAAPWPIRPRYTNFPLKYIYHLRVLLNKEFRYKKLGKIGNGGLCLRRVSIFRNICITRKNEIEDFLLDNHNEDIFWAIFPKELHVPSVSESLAFSFDVKPQLCYQLNGNKLPMGCHGFNKPSRTTFWHQFIPII